MKILATALVLGLLSSCQPDPKVIAPSDIKSRANGVVNHYESALGLKHRADIKIMGHTAERLANGRPAFMLNGVWVHGYAYGGKSGATAVVGKYIDGRWDDENLQHEGGCHCLQLINDVTKGHPDIATHKGKIIYFKQHCPGWRGGATSSDIVIKASGDNYLIIDLVMDDTILILKENKIKTILDEVERELGYE